jgi:uncharacterized membrane-anchored protein
MTVEGWVRPPHYDEHTNNLTWSLSGRSTDGTTSVNHSVRLLGRGGVLKAELVIDPGQLAAGVADFDGVMASTTFVPGQRYAEWREGDKVAEYGLTALVAGGVGAAAVKTGLLGKLGKLVAVGWKLLVGAFVLLGGALKSLFTRRRESQPQAAPR